MIPILAYRIQEQVLGSLPIASARRLLSLGRNLGMDHSAKISFAPGIKPRTRLLRQFGDRVHVVTVEERGYEYRGVRYQSLSEIARLITGTRWSGPLFFGLTRKQSHGL